MSQAGIVDFEGSHPQVPTTFVTNLGTATPIANTLELLGTTVAAHSVPLGTTASGNTVTIEAQYASAAASSIAADAGFSSFNSTQFIVDANGYVSLTGTGAAETITGNTGGPLSPVAGNWNIFGAAGGTTSGSGNTLTVYAPEFIDSVGPATLTTNLGVFATSAATYTLPATAGQGDLIIFICLSTSIVVKANTGQYITLAGDTSSSGGTIANHNTGDSLTLRYRVADSTWYGAGFVGNWDVA